MAGDGKTLTGVSGKKSKRLQCVWTQKNSSCFFFSLNVGIQERSCGITKHLLNSSKHTLLGKPSAYVCVWPRLKIRGDLHWTSLKEVVDDPLDTSLRPRPPFKHIDPIIKKQNMHLNYVSPPLWLSRVGLIKECPLPHAFDIVINS